MASGTGSGSTTGSTTGSTSTSTESTSADPSSSSTTEPTGCWREVEGDLFVAEDSNLDELSDLMSVSGTLYIAIGNQPREDLSFLGCLGRVGSLHLEASEHLRSTAGMAQLSELPWLEVSGYSSLSAIEGLDLLTEIGTIVIQEGHAIELIDLPTIRSVKHLSIGECSWGGGAPAPEPPGPLTSLGGFASLESLEGVSVYGQPSLVDVSVLDALIANGAPPPTSASFWGNVSLAHDEIVMKLEALGVTDYYLCGNLGDAEPCDCPPTG